MKQFTHNCPKSCSTFVDAKERFLDGNMTLYHLDVDTNSIVFSKLIGNCLTLGSRFKTVH
ncbi:MAG: hypothetical protein WCG25_00940 [bacterium]